MGKDWNDILRQKMEGHRKSPPDGLWESIREQMDVTPMAKSRPSIHRRWYYGVAAAMIALVGFFAVYHPQQEEKSSLAEAVPQETVGKKTVESPAGAPREVASSNALQPEMAASSHKSAQSGSPALRHQGGGTQVTGTISVPLLAQAMTAQPDQETAIEKNPTKELSKEVLADTAHVLTAAADQVSTNDQNHHQQEAMVPRYDAMAYANDAHKSRSTSSSDRWSVALKASGGLLAANATEQELPIYYDNSMPGNAYSDYNSINPENSRPKRIRPYRMTEYVADHHLPIRMGVSVQYRLDDYTALQSGINYTYLYSKFSVPLYENSDYEQKLRYIGIPFSVARQLWNKNRFYLYAAAGVMLEKCINDKPWQWSVNGALGVEYRFTRQAGFYLEPSIGYYFKDGTSLEHYYSEHPWAPAIEFGLRLHLKK